MSIITQYLRINNSNYTFIVTKSKLLQLLSKQNKICNQGVPAERLIPSQSIRTQNTPVKRDILVWFSGRSDRATKRRLAIIEPNIKQKGRICP